MDNELFELCKEVYERTGWEPNKEWEADEKHPHWQYNEWYDQAYWCEDPKYRKDVWDDGTVMENGVRLHITPNLAFKGGFSMRHDWMNYYPLYTSDYLLGKLPKYIDADNNPDWASWKHLRMTAGLPEGFNFYYEGLNLDVTADTPLKALLKLTIALHKAGELK